MPDCERGVAVQQRVRRCHGHTQVVRCHNTDTLIGSASTVRGSAMRVDRKWIERNLGFDPIAKSPPAEAFAFAPAARATAEPEDFQREIIDFDSDGTEGREFLAFSTATGMSRFTDIPWPKGLAPKTGSNP